MTIEFNHWCTPKKWSPAGRSEKCWKTENDLFSNKSKISENQSISVISSLISWYRAIYYHFRELRHNRAFLHSLL